MKKWIIRLFSFLAILILSISGRSYAHTCSAPEPSISVNLPEPLLRLNLSPGDRNEKALKFISSSGKQEYHTKMDTTDSESEDDNSASAKKTIAARNCFEYSSFLTAFNFGHLASRLPEGRHFLFAPAYRQHVILGVFRI
jgi:hypothetical protein